jgi:hypothetical protein
MGALNDDQLRPTKSHVKKAVPVDDGVALAHGSQVLDKLEHGGVGDLNLIHIHSRKSEASTG